MDMKRHIILVCFYHALFFNNKYVSFHIHVSGKKKVVREAPEGGAS
jgi:hypothetical protein